MKPVIGITTFNEKRSKKTYATVSSSYVSSIERAGGVPLLLPQSNDETVLDRYLQVIDGLLMSGGDEGVDPRLYGENPVKELACICPERDEFEIYLLKGALDKHMPILGVCRGMQLMNVAGGGSLYQDVFTQVPGALGHLPCQMPVDGLYHSVSLSEGSILASIFETDYLQVNSFHHQAVKDLAPSFKATATTEDNLVEAIEHENYEFVVGIQWHPEDLTAKHAHFLKLFERFIESSKKA